MISDILFLTAINCFVMAVTLLFIVIGLDYFAEVSDRAHDKFDAWMKDKELRELEESIEAGDYWDGENIDYDTGEISANSGASIRYPKNRDRAYSGSVERFHDGGW